MVWGYVLWRISQDDKPAPGALIEPQSIDDDLGGSDEFDVTLSRQYPATASKNNSLRIDAKFFA